MTSATQLVLTGLITAAISVPTSLVLARLTFNFVKQPELEQTLANAFQLEKKKRDLDRADAIRAKVVTWAHPILETANDLAYRLRNICDHKGYLPLASDWDRRRPKNWSATHAYFMNSSIYLFGRYFAQLEQLRWNLGLDLYPQQADKDRLFERIQGVNSALSRWPADFTESCSGGDRQIFFLDQRAMGQMFLDQTAPRPITYAEFLQRSDDLRPYTEPVRDLLEDLSPIPEGNCRWTRILTLRKPLADLQDECRRLIQSVLTLWDPAE